MYSEGERTVAVQTIHHNMTLNNSEKMYNLLENSPQAVIVSSELSQGKSVIQHKRPLAPAPVMYGNNADARCKRKIQFMAYANSPQQPASVVRRNARERNRVKQVNNGFASLRQHIPANVLSAFGTTETPVNGRGGSKKLSKVDTLRVAVEYIKSLQKMLEEHEAELTGKNLIHAIDNRYFPASPESQQYSPYPLALPTPPSSEASTSPTPSHTSEISTSPYHPTTIFVHESFSKTFETKGPDDEELLDAIFSWQQSE